MAAPVPTARQIPAGSRLENGYRTLITFATDPTLAIMEKMTTPSGADGGPPVETFDMFRNRYQTHAPRKLVKRTPVTIVANVDPKARPRLDVLVNLRKEGATKQVITEWWANGDSYCYYGYLQTYSHNAMGDGVQPEVTLTIIPTMEDPVTHTEEPPVYTPYLGTGDPFPQLA